jgi:hypothetical protein
VSEQAISRPEKESYLLVEFRYGTNRAQRARYTDFGRDVLEFSSTPTMKVDIPANGGEFGEREARIVLPTDAFTSRISDGLPHSPTFVIVEERTHGLAAGDEASVLVLFRGQVERAIRNYQGRTNQVALKALPLKSRLDVRLGLQCNIYDEVRLFGPLSGLTQSSHDQAGEIASVDGKEVTIVTPNGNLTAPTAPGGDNDRFWERGWLERDGLRIGVHIWDRLDNPARFVLRQRPPADWVLAGGGSILFVPGTHCTIEDSRDVWDDEEHFLGLGYAMLNYNALYENPQGSAQGGEWQEVP